MGVNCAQHLLLAMTTKKSYSTD